MKKIICGIYKIINTVTGDFYIGSSKDVKRRWAEHKCQSSWNKQTNNPMYLDMRKYSVDKFSFEILEEVEIEKLKETEQQFIEILKPTYNNRRANGWDIERRKEYEKSDKRKESRRKASNKYRQSEKGKKYMKEYNKEYNNQLCSYNGQILTLNALMKHFWRQGIEHPTIEAKKYLVV